MNKVKNFILPFFLSSFYTHASEAYKGKLIDAVTQWPPSQYTLSELNKKIEAAQVFRVGISINPYRPPKALVEKTSKELDLYKKFYKGSPKYFHFSSSLNTKTIDNLIIDIKKYNYSYISEIMYRHADKKQGLTTADGQRTIDPLSKDSLYLMTKLSQNYPKIPVFIHWEFYEWKTDLPKFSKLFKKFPSQIFIINHMGFGSSDEVELLIKEHPNVFFTISKRNTSFEYFQNSKTIQGTPIVDKNRNIEYTWKKLFIDHSDRFLFATDSHKNYMWNVYSKTVQDYRNILAQLPMDIAENIAYKNAEKIFTLAGD